MLNNSQFVSKGYISNFLPKQRLKLPYRCREIYINNILTVVQSTTVSRRGMAVSASETLAEVF